MSTDDSISEDVSSSGPLSHCHASADGDGGKESEASLVSSEGTSASGLAVSNRHTASHTTGGTVEQRPADITPACNKIRTLVLSSDAAFEQEKILPFINPSSLETLRALVQEIQSSGETDPEIWKDCEGRWLHLFQLVEKQYQEQILAQQEQYQCQIQLIQDEIKALVQLQNRQASVPPPSDFPPPPPPPPGAKPPADTKDFLFPLLSGHRPAPDAAPDHAPFGSPSPPLGGQPGEERATTMLSSGYGTLSAWETGPGPGGSPGEEEDAGGGGAGGGGGGKQRWVADFQEEPEDAVIGRPLDLTSGRSLGGDAAEPSAHQQKNSSSQQLTSWAQRHRLRPKRSRVGPAEYQEETHSEPQDQQPAAGPALSSSPLRRSDSLMSEASGLTYWRLQECELYRPLPDSFDSGAYLLLQEASLSLTPPPEPRLSLREIYQNKQRGDGRRSDGEPASGPPSPQVLTLDAAPPTRQSDRTSGFTSPSRFSSPSFAAQPLPSPRVATPVTPDSMAAGSPAPADTDCTSDASSASAAAAGPSPSSLRGSWANAFADGQQGGASEEEGSHTHTSTLKPRPAAAARLRPAVSPQLERASSLEDPVVLSLLRQNLREKHARHVADLKAYYECEIQALRDKLRLQELPQDVQRSNRVLSQRCKHLEGALAEATRRVQELEASNSALEKKLAEWPERYAFAGAALKSLQQRLDESERSGEEKDAAAARLKTRLRQLEEAGQRAAREADEREARREREYKMLQDLLAEFDALTKEHEGVKSNLVSAENKLVDANNLTAELKRVIAKLEAQVKQLEHESQARARHAAHGSTQPSGAGLFHHPDLLLLPSNGRAEPDVTCRRASGPPPEQPPAGAKPAATGQSQKRSPCASTDRSSGSGSWRWSSAPLEQQLSVIGQPLTEAPRRCASPPDGEELHGRHREAPGVLTPVMRALIQLEETRATESRAPWGAGARTTVGFMERRHKESIQERVGVLQVEPAAAVTPAGGGAARSRGGAERAALLRAQRSPDGHRSSSLPPPAHKAGPPPTPAKRETLQAPLSAKSSPKRCPTENYSTAFGHRMPREEHLPSRTDRQLDRRRHSFHSSSPRKRLHFTSLERDDDRQLDSSEAVGPPDGAPQLGWEEPGVCGGPEPLRGPRDEAAPPLLDRLQSLAEAERLFDELTQEKLQIEAALSRMPGAGSRVTLQTRLDEVALEERLERLNRELGSLRMTLKRFHVLRSSANT